MSKHIEDLRYALILTRSQEESLLTHMTRASYLWNTMVKYFQKPTEVYFKEPDTPLSASKYVNSVMEIYETISSIDGMQSANDLQKRLTREYLKLPEQTRNFRLEDFLQASMRAKERLLANPRARPSLPSRKNKRSNKSVKFESSLITLGQGEIAIDVYPKVTLDIPGFHPEQVRDFNSLSLSVRLKPSHVYNPHDSEDADFKATFIKN